MENNPIISMMYRPSKKIVQIWRETKMYSKTQHDTFVLAMYNHNRQRLIAITSIKFSYNSDLISRSPPCVVLLSQYHPQSKKCHDCTMTKISKHHRKQEGKGDNGIRSCAEKKKK